MVQISKLTKNEIKETGFNNRSIPVKFMKTVMNKTVKDFKKKDALINALKKEFTKMKNFGIDLNENAQTDRKHNKIEKTITKQKAEFENYLIKNEENLTKHYAKFIKNTFTKQKQDFQNHLIKNMNDEAVLEMSIDDYLKGIAYEIPKNIDYQHTYKKKILMNHYKN
jgi:hypothetical protein